MFKHANDANKIGSMLYGMFFLFLLLLCFSQMKAKRLLVFQFKITLSYDPLLAFPSFLCCQNIYPFVFTSKPQKSASVFKLIVFDASVSFIGLHICSFPTSVFPHGCLNRRNVFCLHTQQIFFSYTQVFCVKAAMLFKIEGASSLLLPVFDLSVRISGQKKRLLLFCCVSCWLALKNPKCFLSP